MATPIFICGAECGIVTAGASGLTPHWDGSFGTPAISTTTVRNGLRAYRFNPTASTTYLWKNVTTKRLIGRLAFRFATLPVVDQVDLITLSNTSGYIDFQIDTATGKILCKLQEVVVYGPVIAVNTWYVLDFYYNTEGATATLDWKINEVAQTQAARVQSSNNTTAFTMGLATINNSADLFIDDIILSYTAADYPFGDGKVLGLSPNVDGTHSFTLGNFIYNAAGANIPINATDVHTYVDERPITNGADFINQKLAAAAEYVEIGFEDTAETTDARGMEVVCSLHAAAAQSSNAAMNLNDNGTIATVYPLTALLTELQMFNTKQFAKAPSTNLAWTQARINALKLRWGYSADANPDRYFDAVILEIEWAVAASGPQTITNAGAIASQEAFGTPSLKLNQFISNAGAIISLEAFGTSMLILYLSSSGISSQEAFGTLKLILYLSPSSIDTAEAFGSAKLILFLLPSGVSSLETFGTAKVILFLLPSGIASAEVFGNAQLNLFLSPSGIASSEAFGSSKLTLYLLPSGIVSSEAFGSQKVNLKVAPSEIVTAEVFGTPKIIFTLLPSGIVTEETFGTPTVISGAQFLLPSSIDSGEVFGDAKLNLQIVASGIISAEDFGTPNIAIEQFLSPSGIASEETFGSTRLILFLVASGIPTGELFGLPLLTLKISPLSIVSGEAFGVPQLTLAIIPTGIPSQEAFGSSQLNLQIVPVGISSQETFGTPFLITLQILQPLSIISLETFGTPEITIYLIAVGIGSEELFGTPLIIIPLMLFPSGIPSVEAFGVPLIVIPQMLYPDSIVSAEMLGSAEVILWAHITQKQWDEVTAAHYSV